MTNPAEKIRQVVEATAVLMDRSLDCFENLAAAEEMTKFVARQVLDAVIDLSKERGGDYADAFGMFMSELEEARSSLDGGCTSITNNHA